MANPVNPIPPLSPPGSRRGLDFSDAPDPWPNYRDQHEHLRANEPKTNGAEPPAPPPGETAAIAPPSDDDETTLRLIEQYIAEPPIPAGSRVFRLSPAVSWVLRDKHNTKNRPFRPAAIAQYKKDMSAPDWLLTGEAIIFSISGRLLNGQNRLTACIEAGVPFVTDIRFGIADEAFRKMDSGRVRTGADLVSIEDYPNCKVLSGAVRLARHIENKQVKGHPDFSSSEILDLLKKHYDPGLVDVCPQAQRIYRAQGVPTASQVAALLYHFNLANPVKAADFALAWETGRIGGRYRPLELLHKKLAQWRTTMSSGTVPPIVYLATVILAWNLFVAGRKGKLIELEYNRAEDDFPEIARE